MRRGKFVQFLQSSKEPHDRGRVGALAAEEENSCPRAARAREAAAYNALSHVDVSVALLLAEQCIPGWAWGCPTRNVAERHDPKAVRPS